MSGRHVLLAVFLICTSVFSLVYAIHESSMATDLAYSQSRLRADLARAQTELQTLTAQLRSQSETDPNVPAAPLPAARALPKSARVRRPQAVAQSYARPRVAEDPRWKRVESQLAEHRSQLARQSERIDEAQQTVQRTGDQLDGKINSTRDELNRSIATTHDGVGLLQKRGERNVYEFDLTRSKKFQRIGPLNLSLRKTDAKHRAYDLSVIVDDVNLDKKHVNLFEPVWIHLPDQSQPIQLVVNHIDKNQVRGYISEPRYKTQELGGAPTPATPPAPALKPRSMN